MEVKTPVVAIKVIQGHWQWCLSLNHIYDFLFVLHCNYMYVSVLDHYRDIVTYFSKFKEDT